MPVPVQMPALSPTMEEGTLSKWFVGEGDSVAAGDPIFEIETDKATMEVEAIEDGTLARIIVPGGTEHVKVNDTVGMMLAEGEDEGALDEAVASKSAPSTPAAAVVEPVAATAAPTVEPTPTAKSNGQRTSDGPADRIFASPLARRLAAVQNLDLTAISGSGPHGRIVKRDIEAAGAPGTVPSAKSEKVEKAMPEGTKSKETAPAVELPEVAGYFEEGTYEVVPLETVRKAIARRLTESKQQIPHYYLTVDCEIDRMLSMLDELNEKTKKDETANFFTINDFVIRASAVALLEVPDVNVTWGETSVLRHKRADVAVAVAADVGLITPIVRDAGGKPLSQISVEMKDLAKRARNKKLMPMEYEGGTFTVSNLGMFGIREFTAVINPPHSAILAVGAGAQRPVVKDGELTVATVMTVTLSCDHRTVDGAMGASWLKVFKRLIENPATILA